MAQRDVASFKATKNSRFANNTSGLITEANHRDTHEDVADSFLNKTDNFIDDDTFATASATTVPSSESVKAYVGAQVGSPIQSVTRTLTTAEILSGSSSPVTILAAQGAGTIIQVLSPIIWRWNYETAAFATNTTSRLYYNSTAPLTTVNTVIGLVGDRYEVLAVQDVDYPDSTMSNTPITWAVSTGNPTGGGTSTLTIHFKYYVLTL